MGIGDRTRKTGLAVLTFGVVTALALLTASQSTLASSPGAAAADDLGPLSGHHLYLVPANAKGDAAVEQTDARTVAGYDTFSLVSADGSANPTLRAAGADLRDDMRSVAVADGEARPRGGAGARRRRARVAVDRPVRRAGQGRLARPDPEDRSDGGHLHGPERLSRPRRRGRERRGLGARRRRCRARRDAVHRRRQDRPGRRPAPGRSRVTVQTLAGPAGEPARRVLAAGKHAPGATRRTTPP